MACDAVQNWYAWRRRVSACGAWRIGLTRGAFDQGAVPARTELTQEPRSGSGTGSIRAPCTPTQEVRARGRHARYVVGHQHAPLNRSVRLKRGKQAVLD